VLLRRLYGVEQSEHVVWCPSMHLGAEPATGGGSIIDGAGQIQSCIHIVAVAVPPDRAGKAFRGLRASAQAHVRLHRRKKL